MSRHNNKLIFLVDDDALFLKSLELDFKQNTPYTIKTFALGEECLNNLHLNPNIIVLDYLLDGIKKNAITGLEMLDKIKELRPTIPVIILSSQDKMDVALNCMKHQAYDYVVKSETTYLRLQKAINAVFHYQEIDKALKLYLEKCDVQLREGIMKIIQI